MELTRNASNASGSAEVTTHKENRYAMMSVAQPHGMLAAWYGFPWSATRPLVLSQMHLYRNVNEIKLSVTHDSIIQLSKK